MHRVIAYTNRQRSDWDLWCEDCDFTALAETRGEMDTTWLGHLWVDEPAA